MADKAFGVKDINLIGASGTPTIESPNNLNINAVNVAISTDITVAGKVSLGAGTSISSPGTNILTLGTNSVERVRVTSTGNIGIGNTNPLYAMHFKNAMSSTPSYIHMEVTGTNTIGGGGGIQFDTSASNNASNNGLYLAQISGERSSSNDGSNLLVFKTSKAGVAGDDSVTNSPKTRMTIDEDGRVRMPDQPAFYAYRNSDSGQTTAGDQIFDATKTNRGNHYSTSNGRFTAPVAGAYFFSAALQLYGGPTTGTMMSFRINGTDFHGSQNSSNPVYDEPAGNHGMLYFSAVITLAANEYVTTWTNNTVRGMQSYFTGYLVG